MGWCCVYMYICTRAAESAHPPTHPNPQTQTGRDRRGHRRAQRAARGGGGAHLLPLLRLLGPRCADAALRVRGLFGMGGLFVLVVVVACCTTSAFFGGCLDGWMDGWGGLAPPQLIHTHTYTDQSNPTTSKINPTAPRTASPPARRSSTPSSRSPRRTCRPSAAAAASSSRWHRTP